MLGFLIKLALFFGVLFYIFALKFDFYEKETRFCVESSGRRGFAPDFHYVSSEKKHVNTGGQACIEDVVKYANRIRAGSDGLVGTKDDKSTLEEQVSLILKLLKQEYPGAFWADSPWFLSQNAGAVGQFKLLYGDMNEYIGIFASRFHSGGGYSGSFSFDVWDFLIEGTMYTQFIGNMTRSVFTPHAGFKEQLENLTPEDKESTFVALLPKGQQKIYWGHPVNGQVMIEYARGKIVTSIYQAMIMPFLFLNLDCKSLWMHIRHYGESVIRNSFLSYVSKPPANSSTPSPNGKNKHNYNGRNTDEL